MACQKHYLLESIEDAHCMRCRKAFTMDVLDTIVNKTFRCGPYKLHRENILFNRERALLVETQPYADRCCQVEKLQKSIKDLQAEKKKIDAKLREANNELFTLKTTAVGDGGAGGSTERKQYVRHCPGNGCRGFLNDKWHCTLCEANVCSACHEVYDGDKSAHECDPSLVANVKAIMSSTKPCPKCSTPTFKIDGCDQMWCVVDSCHTAWNWRTGKVERGIIHNPHYYEYLRNQSSTGEIPRNPNECANGFPMYRTFLNHMRQNAITNTHIDWFSNIHRNVNHIVNVVTRDFEAHEYNTNRDLRIQYLLNRMTEKDLKITLQRREKARNKKMAIFNVLETFSMVATDTFNKMFICTTKKEMEATILELDGIRLYCNEHMKKISSLYNCVAPFINYNYSVQYKYSYEFVDD